jgi:hypothetical protein
LLKPGVKAAVDDNEFGCTERLYFWRESPKYFLIPYAHSAAAIAGHFPQL